MNLAVRGEPPEGGTTSPLLMRQNCAIILQGGHRTVILPRSREPTVTSLLS